MAGTPDRIDDDAKANLYKSYKKIFDAQENYIQGIISYKSNRIEESKEFFMNATNIPGSFS